MKSFNTFSPCRWLALLTALLVAAQTVAAADATNSPPAASAPALDSLVADALARNPELKFYEAEIAAARAGRKTAGLLANPELSGSIGVKRVSGGGKSAEGIAWSASVLQPFEWPGRLGLRKAIANRDVELAELGLTRFRLALTGRVRTLAYGLFATHEKAAAAHEVADRFQALREVLVQRDPTGLTPLLETRIIEATEITARRNAGLARLAAQTSLLELNQLCGASFTTNPFVTEPALTLRAAPGTATLLDHARTNNFELRLRQLELAQQGLRTDLAKSERYPAISVGPTLSGENAGGERESIIGLGLSLPLPLWNRNTGNIEAAAARQLQAGTSLAVAQRELERSVREAALTYETHVSAMSHWPPDAFKRFSDAAELADRHYRLGAVPVNVYVELQEKYLSAVEALLDTKTEALQSAQQLELLTGLPLLPPDSKATSE